MGIVSTAICSKITDEADALLMALEAYKGTLLSQLSALRNYLSGMSWSPSSAVNSAIDAVLNNMGNMVPDLSEFDEVVQMIYTCVFLQNSSSLSTPSALARSISQKVIDNADSQISTVTSSLPEFEGGKLYESISRHIQTKVTPSISKVRQVLECMSSLCGTDITSRAARLNTFINDCNLDGDGNLNVDNVLTDAGIHDVNQITNFKNVKSSVSTVYSNIDSSVSNGVNYLKIIF